jgi:hypothetical protein
MISSDFILGSTNQGTSIADIIINNINGVAEGQIQGFAQFVFDPKTLRDSVTLMARSAIPKRFADAVLLRRLETQRLDDIWNFPLNMTVPSASPLPWTLVEAQVKSQSALSFEFGLMRTVDFIGRNYVRLVLPYMDTTEVVDSSINNNSDILSDPDHIYMGAWFRDLIPRIINRVLFYPRSNTHTLFEYTGYAIYVHNILFGNANKAMNDLMAGEDQFELCYDPYRVEGSAMGISSFKGIDAFSEYTMGTPDADNGGLQSYTGSAQVLGATDGIWDYMQIDTTMDSVEFRDIYRRNVWYEAPIAQNYWSRHSIHSRRMFHQAKEILFPLDILPFGYSIGSSLPAASISSDCGFIKVEIHADWLDRAFYLTKVSDIPSLHPLVNHTHYVAGDTTPSGDELQATDPRINWVNERSPGRFGDPSFGSTDAATDPDFETKTYNATEGNIVNARHTSRKENIVQVRASFDGIEPANARGLYRGTNGTKIAAAGHAVLRRTGNMLGASRTPTSQNAYLDSSDVTYIHKLSSICSDYYERQRTKIQPKLLQVGYQSLPCIREFLSRLPNIYITTEWHTEEVSIDNPKFDILNDLYIQSIILWFLPTDTNGIDSMRMYPNHKIDTELPVIAGLKLCNEQSQGNTNYDWPTLNLLNPAQMKLNPLIENMGLISFTPEMSANTFPLSYYDSNVTGYLKATILQNNTSDERTRSPAVVNLKAGKLLVMSVGINGVAGVNLNLFRLIF